MRIGNWLSRSFFIVLMAALVALAGAPTTAQNSQNVGAVAVAIDVNEDDYFKNIYRYFS